MKIRSVLLFIGMVFIFSYVAQISARAFWIQQNGRLMWFNGQVLGTTDAVVYTYIIRARPTSYPTLTPFPTVSSSSSSSSQMYIAEADMIVLQTVSSSSTGSSSSRRTAASINTANAGGNPHSSSSSSSSYISSSSSSVPWWQSSSSSSRRSSSSSSISYCGGYICMGSQTCYQNICREKCRADGTCLGMYSCIAGACVPATGGVNSSYGIAPTITPLPSTTPVPEIQISSAASSKTSVISTPIIPVRLTNTPYPTRTPKNVTFFNSGGGGTPVFIPTPTPIPEILRGKSSTIVIETENSTTILKGEDVNAIKIAAPAYAAEHVSSTKSLARQSSSGGRQPASDQGPTPAPDNALDLSFQQKSGSSFAVHQDELVVEKGKQRVTISVANNNGRSLILTQNDIRANVDMSLSINPSTNILTVDTPSGPMRVSIMPDDAVGIIRQLKVADPNKIPSDVTLMSKNNQLQYKISATKLQKLFWVIPITIPQEVYVSADTGGLIAIQRTGVYSFISLFTF